MVITKKLNADERLISINYSDMDTLLKRKSKMTNTLQNYLDRSGKKHNISDTYISLDEIGVYKINYVLTINQED